MNILKHLTNMFWPRLSVPHKSEPPNPELQERAKLKFETAMLVEATDRLSESSREIENKIKTHSNEIDRFAALLRSMRTTEC